MTRAFISVLPDFVSIALFVGMIAVWAAIGGGA